MLTYRLWGIVWIVLMSPFSWQCQNLCLLTLAFIIYWRVVHSLSIQFWLILVHWKDFSEAVGRFPSWTWTSPQFLPGYREPKMGSTSGVAKILFKETDITRFFPAYCHLPKHIPVLTYATYRFAFRECSSIQICTKKIDLPDRESNPGLPRDRRGYWPLYYRGLDGANNYKCHLCL